MSIALADLGRLVLAAACWGLGTVVSKAALDHLPALTLLAVQLGSSLVVLAVLLRRQRGASTPGPSPRLARLGLLNPGLAYALSLLGLTTISASLSVLLWALEPLLIVVLAAFVLGERITRTFMGLSLAAVVGMALVVWDPTATTGDVLGLTLTIAGVACCAVYTVATRRFLPDSPETTQVAFAQQAHALALAGLLLVGLGVAGGVVLPEPPPPPLAIASAVGSGVLYYAAAYWAYLGALRRVPASIAAVSFYLIPIVGLAAGATVLGERLQPQQWAGAGVVLIAVALLTLPLGRRSVVVTA